MPVSSGMSKQSIAKNIAKSVSTKRKSNRSLVAPSVAGKSSKPRKPKSYHPTKPMLKSNKTR